MFCLITVRKKNNKKMNVSLRSKRKGSMKKRYNTNNKKQHHKPPFVLSQIPPRSLGVFLCPEDKKNLLVTNLQVYKKYAGLFFSECTVNFNTKLKMCKPYVTKLKVKDNLLLWNSGNIHCPQVTHMKLYCFSHVTHFHETFARLTHLTFYQWGSAPGVLFNDVAILPKTLRFLTVSVPEVIFENSLEENWPPLHTITCHSDYKIITSTWPSCLKVLTIFNEKPLDNTHLPPLPHGLEKFVTRQTDIKKYPDNLHTLVVTFGNSSLLNIIASHLETFTMICFESLCFNFNLLPASLTHLKIQRFMDQPITFTGSLPKLIKLDFGCISQLLQPLVLPDSLQEFSGEFVFSIDIPQQWPSSLTKLKLNRLTSAELVQFPSTLKDLHLTHLRDPITNPAWLPCKLESLHLLCLEDVCWIDKLQLSESLKEVTVRNKKREMVQFIPWRQMKKN